MGLCAASLASITSCKNSSFEEFYRDPSKVSTTTVEKQFAGMVYQFRELIVPSYWNYFVILRTTANRYTQSVGWANEANQLLPGSAAMSDRWNFYYKGLAQFRELESIYNKLSTEDQASYRIYYLAAKIFIYDQTQQMVDLYGDIPFSEAGKLSPNGGDYSISYAKFDAAEDIYTTMLDDLKSISTELNSTTIASGVLTGFTTQDLINGGSLTLWKKYCNSLRVRMLTRVSGASAFSSRSSSELATILGDQTTYPLVLDNADNIDIDIYNISSDINSSGFQTGLEDWNGNIAGKVMIDNMKANVDPRLPFMFEPGAKSDSTYIGLDQSLTSAAQTDLISGVTNGGTIAIYNRSTYSRNKYFPGNIITASEVNYLLAEYYNNNSALSTAKTYFETGIKQSIALQVSLRSISSDNTVAAATAPTSTEIATYISNIGWGTDNIQRIATQKWLHFNVIQSMESWTEIRRLDYPTFSFRTETSDTQKVLPSKFTVPDAEKTQNATNYAAVKDQDDINVKLFWDTK